jgi:hypothetical protein
VAAKTYELSEFLVDVLGVIDVGAYFPYTVTYHPTCHSLRMLRVGDNPIKLPGGTASWSGWTWRAFAIGSRCSASTSSAEPPKSVQA